MWYNSQGALQRGEAALVGHVSKAVKTGDLESHFWHLDLGFLIHLTLHIYALCKPMAEAEETWGRYLGGQVHPRIQGHGPQSTQPEDTEQGLQGTNWDFWNLYSYKSILHLNL